MTPIIRKVSRDDLLGLISHSDGLKLTDDAAVMYARFVEMSPLVWAGYADDALVCSWGLIPASLLSDRAYLWLQASDKVADHAFVFIRQSQIAVQQMLERFSELHGHCQVGKEKSIRWLKFLKAEFATAEGNLIPFTIRREQWQRRWH